MEWKPSLTLRAKVAHPLRSLLDIFYVYLGSSIKKEIFLLAAFCFPISSLDCLTIIIFNIISDAKVGSTQQIMLTKFRTTNILTNYSSVPSIVKFNDLCKQGYLIDIFTLKYIPDSQSEMHLSIHICIYLSIHPPICWEIRELQT